MEDKNRTITEPGRATGATTRLVDTAIQSLFNSGYSICKDHCPHPLATKDLHKRIIGRLSNEHYLGRNGSINATIHKGFSVIALNETNFKKALHIIDVFDGAHNKGLI